MVDEPENDQGFVYVKRAFACGTQFKEFRTAFCALPEDDRARLIRVGWRMWVTLMLRYRVDVFSNDALQRNRELMQAHTEWKTLELYLLVTCLDTLAGKAKHLTFDAWLQRKHGGQTLEVQEVTSLFQRYHDEYGVRRNLKNTFENLPEPGRRWVTNVIRLAKGAEWFTWPDNSATDTDTQLTRLLNHFFDFRNRYTHSSIVSAPMVSSCLSADPENEEWRYSLLPINNADRDKPSKRLTLVIRKGLDEATVLRIVLVVVAAKMLGVPVSDQLIHANMEKLARLDSLYAFTYELTANAHAANRWYDSAEAEGELLWYSLWRGLPKFQTERTEILIDRMWPNPLESGLKEWLQGYLGLLKETNHRIEEFNASHPIFDDRKVNELQPEEREQRYDEIRDFLRQNEQEWRGIVGIASSIPASNLWLVICDPCYC